MPTEPKRIGPPELKGGSIILASPIGGVVKTTNREGQPEGTCWDALNVLPYDRTGRKRVAQRTGTSKQFANRLDTTAITSLNQILVSFVPTVAKSQLLLDETWNYPAGFVETNSGNWVAASLYAGVNSNGWYCLKGYNTGADAPPGSVAAPQVGPSSTKFAAALSGTLSSSYSLIFSGTYGTSNLPPANTTNTVWFVIGEDSNSGKSYQVSIANDHTHAVVVTLFGYNNTVASGSVSHTFAGVNSVTGIFELQITESGGSAALNLIYNGTSLLTTTIAFIPASHNLITAWDHSISGVHQSVENMFVTTRYIQLWNVIGFSAATLPFTETFPYTSGNLTAVSPFWSIDVPGKTPASLYQVTAPGTLTWEATTATNGFLPTVSFKGPLGGLGRQWTVTAQVFLELSAAVAAKDATSFHITAGSPTGIAYDLSCQFVSPDGSSITPSVVLNITKNGKLLETQSGTPSGVTNTFNDNLILQVDQTQSTTTVRAYWAGVLLFAHTTVNNLGAVSIGWGFKINWTNAALKANVFGFLFSFAIASGLTVPTVNAIAHSTLVATCNGCVWLGLAGTDNQVLQLATGQTVPPLTPGVLPGVAGIFEEVYFVDGTHIAQLDIPTAAMVVYTVTANPANPNPTPPPAPTGCTMACNWRGRLVLAGDPSNPQNFFMSRSGVPTEWDYSQIDPLAAIIGNASTYGQIGEPITALIPFSDDTMILGCSHSVWLFQGDPADGGTLVNLSDNMGIVGPRAWCKDTTGNMYFIGTGGLFKLPGTATLLSPIRAELLSGENMDAFFRGLNPTSDYITMTFDSDTHYLHIFVTPSSGGQGVHLVRDDRNSGLWPVQFPVSHGPVSVCQFFGDYSANTRSIMLGGWDGYIRKLDDAAIDDDGTAISAYVVLGPIHPTPQASLLKAVTVDFGELLPDDADNNPSLWNVSATLRTGPTAFDVTEGTPNQTYTVSCVLDGRTKTFRQRLRGGWFSLMIANNTLDTYFAFEQAELEINPAGRNRGQR